MNLTDITKQIRAFADQLESTQTPAPADPYAELKAAHAAGEVIEQVGHGSGDWFACGPEIAWTRPLECYRVRAFQLPPPPPGMQWHRTDGWKAEDLPPGTRPHVYGEGDSPGDEVLANGHWNKTRVAVATGSFESNNHRRTTRPLVFTHEGKSWTYHRPGDPMPCDGEAWVTLLLRSAGAGKTATANNCYWDTSPSLGSQIIGWRYAEPITREVELGPEDVPPGSVVRPDHWTGPVWINVEKVCVTDCLLAGESGKSFPWAYLKAHGWLINRPRHRDADGNPTKWEKCSKEVPA